MAETISETLDAQRVVMELRGRKKPEILRELLETILSTVQVGEIDTLFDDLMDHERSASSGIGDGIAIPHTFSPAVDRTTMAVGRCSGGVKFNAVDNKPVKLFFLMVGPEGSHVEHLRLLSKLSRFLHDSDFRRALLEAGEAGDVIELFSQKER